MHSHWFSTNIMEHLNKSQIVLLTLFVSFVASMATGIVVVTLMQQSPEPVVQTITNVVERTIEKVTPTFIDKPGKTLIIKDEDLVVAAIERNSKSIVALKFVGEEGVRFSVGIGTIVSTDGLIVTDKRNFDVGLLSVTVDGTSYTVEIVKSDKNTSLVLARLVPATTLATSTKPVIFTPVTFGNPDILKIGQTAIIIGGRDGRTVSAGLITNLDTRLVINKETKVETKILDNIGISQRLAGTSNGAPIITLSGEVVGFVSIDDSIGSQAGAPVTEAKSLITALTTPAPAIKK